MAYQTDPIQGLREKKLNRQCNFLQGEILELNFKLKINGGSK